MIRLRELREKLDLSQTDVAQALYISRQIYNFYENGRRSPKPDMLIKLADFYNVSIDYLLDHTVIAKQKKVDEPPLEVSSTSKLCTTDEHTLIKNFRLLSPDGQERILHQCEYEVSLLNQEKHAEEAPAG